MFQKQISYLVFVWLFLPCSKFFIRIKFENPVLIGFLKVNILIILIHGPYLWRTWFYINFIKHFYSVLKISNVFFLRASNEYLTRYGQGPVFKIRISGSLSIFLKKKTKVLDNFNTKKKCFMKINIESSPPDILIRIRFHNGIGSSSLVISVQNQLPLMQFWYRLSVYQFLTFNFLLFYIKSWTKINIKIISIKGKKSECYSCVLCIMFTTLRLTSHVKEKILHLLDIIYLFESVSLKHWDKEHITQYS